MNLFKTGPTTNLLPFGIAFDKASNTSVIFDRLYRPIIACAGKFPRCDLSLAVACDIDDKPLFGVTPIYQFFREDCQPAVDPPVRARLRKLIASCSALRDELHRRALIQSHDATQPEPKRARSHAHLVNQVFGGAAA
jgi:hypothetical protein